MPTYFIASYDIHDEAGYQDYLAGVVPLLQKHGAEILVADYAPQTIEGQACGANIVLRFDSEEAARGWYDDSDYQPVKQLRFDTSENGTALLAKGFVPPS